MSDPAQSQGRDEQPESAPTGRLAARGAAVTMAGQLGRTAVQMVGVVVLARLLSPQDYGLTTMVLAVIGVGEIFRDFGLGAAAIQARRLTAGQRANLFWINTLIGALLAGVVVAISGPIATMYGDPRLQEIALWLSLTFLFNGMSTQFRASLNRAYRFSALVVVDVSSVSIALIAGVVAAFAGMGYWAIVIQSLVLAVLGCLTSAGLAGWWPGLPRRHSDMRELFAFGWPVTLVNLLGYASRNIDSVVVGMFYGPTALGLYDRAFQLLMIPLNQLNAPATRVALPVLSRLQDDPEKYFRFVLRGQAALVHLIVSSFTFAAALAPWLVPLVLGAGWGGTVPVFQMLVAGGIFQVAGYATYWVFVSTGRTRSNLNFALCTRPLVILLILAGAPFGIVGVAAGYAAGMMLLWPIGLFWIRKVPAVKPREMFLNGARPILVYGSAGGLAVVASGMLPNRDLLVLLAVILVYVLVVALAFGWRRFRHDVQDAFSIIKLVRKPS